MFLHDYLYQLEKNKTSIAGTPPAILWLDAGGRFGHADPFDPQQSDALLMNGPTYMLRPSLAKPDLFHNYYRGQTGSDDLEGFIPRNLYGRFLQDLVPALLEKAQHLGITITRQQATITAIHKTPQRALQLVSAEGQRWQADHLALATGPARNRALDHLRGQSGFIDNPSRANSFANSGIDFSNPATQIACFGPGPSCFDGMALLEKEFGFKGKYILVGRANIPFWSIQRNSPVPNDSHYRPRHLSAEALPCPVTESQLIAALFKDIDDLKDPQHNRFEMGPEYLLNLVSSQTPALYARWQAHHRPDALAAAQSHTAFLKLQRVAIKMLEQAVSPQMQSLYQNLKDQGRILQVSGRIQEDAITKPNALFTVPVVRQDGLRLNYRSAGIMNCKPHVRSWQPGGATAQEQLLAQMTEQGLIRQNKQEQLGLYDFIHGLQNRVALLGAATDVLWGVHLSSYKNGQAAEFFASKLTPWQRQATPVLQQNS